MRVKLTSRNRLTIPSTVLAGFPGCGYFDVRKENGRIVLTPVRTGRSDSVRAKLSELRITEDDVDGAVAWARQPAPQVPRAPR